VDEATLLSVADYVATHLAPSGFTLLTLDEGWSERDGQILTDAYGRPTPNPAMYPSSAGGVGLSHLVAQLRARGLQLGLWLLRGVPREAAAAALPIANSSLTTAQAVRLDKPCAWNAKTHGSAAGLGGKGDAAASAYYASVASLFAEWGVEVVKGDCFFPDKPSGDEQPSGFFDDELVVFSSAMARAGLKIMLSPGISVTPRNGTFLAAHAAELGVASYRVTEDTWGMWEGAADGTFPQGVGDKLRTAACFAPLIGANGTYPDLDMLPLGRIYNASAARGVVGPAAPTSLTAAEQRAAVTLYSIAHSPLILGGALPLAPNDSLTLPLLTNPEILFLNGGRCADPHPLRVPGQPADQPRMRAWSCAPATCPAGAVGACAAVAFFNAAEAAGARVPLLLADVMPQPAASQPPVRLCARDLWRREPRALTAGGAAAPTMFSVPVADVHGAEALLLWWRDGALDGECSSGAEVFRPPLSADADDAGFDR